MKEDGVIRDAKSEWASLVVRIPKLDGSMRFCVDYCRLNELTVPDAYPLPSMEDFLDSLGDAAFFATLDCNSGYWQNAVTGEDRAKTRLPVTKVASNSAECPLVSSVRRRRFSEQSACCYLVTCGAPVWFI